MKNMASVLSVITLERVDLARINYVIGTCRKIIEEPFEALTVVGRGGPALRSFLGDDFNDLTAQNLDLLDEMKPGDRLHFIVEKDGEARKFTLVCLSQGNKVSLPEFYCSGLFEA